MCDLCNDNRFELIEKYKKKLIEATNIETAPDEMTVLDNILFRFWQMGWLDKLELPSAQPEPLTDREQRLFLSAMTREEKVCKQVDDDFRYCREPYDEPLVRACKEIVRKVKGSLWTN